jgi:hypothetical protein
MLLKTKYISAHMKQHTQLKQYAYEFSELTIMKYKNKNMTYKMQYNASAQCGCILGRHFILSENNRLNIQ